MKWIVVGAQRATGLVEAPDGLPVDGFLWLDMLHDEVIADPDSLREAVQRITDVRLDDLHV